MKGTPMKLLAMLAISTLLCISAIADPPTQPAFHPTHPSRGILYVWEAKDGAPACVDKACQMQDTLKEMAAKRADEAARKAEEILQEIKATPVKRRVMSR